MSKRHHDNPANEAADVPTISAIAADTMLGDLMACLIDEFKTAPDVWQKMPEYQQQDVIYRVQQRVQENIRAAVEIIASANRPTIVATVESVTVKDGIKAVLTLPKSDAQRHELFDASGQTVLLIVGGASEYYGGASEVRPDPDQPALNGLGDEPLADAA